MHVTEVRVHGARTSGRVRGWASVTLADAYAIHDLRIIEGSNGLFVSMPSRRRASGDYYDVVHPITAEAREQLQKSVLAEYGRITQQTADAV